MTRGILSLRAVVCLLLAGCSRGSDAPSAAPSDTPAAQPKSVPTVLILDASGSMTEADAPGPRIDAAKTAAHGLLKALPDDSTLGLLAYGTAMGSAIDAISPSGYTPISRALQTGADALPDGATAIVLVSDGEDTCDTPPCDTATNLKKTHPGLTISTVGFKVDGTAADQLRCIAETTGGVFVQAANADQLAARLLATQNIDQANQSLSATGIFGINLGTNITDIRTTHPDFPDATTTGTRQPLH
ncbi:MAG: VWA domain-containing protein [Mycobacterium sp.]|nr:VWA domain-containing protein [Mycobacterium sp.]